jgi:ATP-dependent RNA helicase DDX24/MAK5
LTEAYVPCRLEEKDAMLYAFQRCHPGRTLVFLNSVSSVRRLANVFGLLQCTPACCSPQTWPPEASTSSGVQHVIHYHVPRTSEVRFRHFF